DPARRQRARAGRDRLADRDRPLRDRLALDLLAARALDRARDARAHPEVVVRRVRDRVDLEPGDVALDDLELHARIMSGNDEGRFGGRLLRDDADLDPARLRL